MKEKIRKILMEDSRTEEYTQVEIEIAINQIVQFLNKLKELKVLEDNQERPLNQLESFVAINEFVTNRIYEESKKSHDVVGACVTGKIVCEGFCKLTQLLCNQVGIKNLYKNSRIHDKEGFPVCDEKTGSPLFHGNMEVFIKDKSGDIHCLHCDPTIDSLRGKDIMTYNATLIPDENIQKYKRTQVWEASVNRVWKDLVEGVTPESQNEKLTPDFMDEILGTDRLGDFRPPLIEMANCMELDGKMDLSTKDECLELYEKIYKEYQKAKLPIDNNEYLEALINVQKVTLAYETNLSSQEIEEKSKSIIKERIQASIGIQQEDWDSDCKSSFIVDVAIGKFDYETVLESCTSLTNTQRLGKETIEELEDTTYLDETEKQELVDIEKMQTKDTQEK